MDRCAFEDAFAVAEFERADLEDDREVSLEEGRELAAQWEGALFLESSAKTNENVDNIFIHLVRQVNLQDQSDASSEPVDGGSSAPSDRKCSCCVI